MTTTMKLKGMAVLVAAVATGASLRSFASDDYIDTANGTYTALEYIKGNGSAVIITDFTPAGDDKVVTRFMPVTVKSDTTEFLFCTRNIRIGGLALKPRNRRFMLCNLFILYLHLPLSNYPEIYMPPNNCRPE